MKAARRSSFIVCGVAATSALLVVTTGQSVSAAGGSPSLSPARAAGAVASVHPLVPVSKKVSSDPYTNAGPQHSTEAEPDTFAVGNTIVSVFQVARYSDGGADNIGWATSSDAGVTWKHGFLPGITTSAGGQWARVSDPAVAYDAKHAVWLASGLVIDAGANGRGVSISRSSNGLRWRDPVIAAGGTSGFYDKEWVACDSSPASPHYGNCYVEVDLSGQGNRIVMVTSSDGGRTWSAEKSPADTPSGLGGQPLVKPDGTVVVPYSANFGSVRAFTSTNGGSTWNASVLVSSSQDHAVTGMRQEPMPTAEMDSAGKVYVAWDDCRFRSGCSSNDIVMSTSTNGTTWSSVVRIPIDGVTSGRDHFTPGLGVDPTTSGNHAKLGLYYYFYPDAACAPADCRLKVGYVSSVNGGQTWSAPQSLAKPAKLAWLAQAGGAMVGDYISCSVMAGQAVSVYAIGHQPSGATKHQPMATAGPLTVTGGSRHVSPDGAVVRGSSAPAHRFPSPLL
jgi:hypothetical protein